MPLRPQEIPVQNVANALPEVMGRAERLRVDAAISTFRFDPRVPATPPDEDPTGLGARAGGVEKYSYVLATHGRSDQLFHTRLLSDLALMGYDAHEPSGSVSVKDMANFGHTLANSVGRQTTIPRSDWEKLHMLARHLECRGLMGLPVRATRRPLGARRFYAFGDNLAGRRPILHAEKPGAKLAIGYSCKTFSNDRISFAGLILAREVVDDIRQYVDGEPVMTSFFVYAAEAGRDWAGYDRARKTARRLAELGLAFTDVGGGWRSAVRQNFLGLCKESPIVAGLEAGDRHRKS